jgi:hypothetical protein
VTPKHWMLLAQALVALSVTGAVVSPFTFAKGEPPTILALSWLSPILTALDIWRTTELRHSQDEPKPRKVRKPHARRTPPRH